MPSSDTGSRVTCRAHASDAFAQPRDPENGLHGLAIGAWEYIAVVGDPGPLIRSGWEVVYSCESHTTLKYTHWERIS